MLDISIIQVPLVSFALAVNNVAIMQSVAIKNGDSSNYEGLMMKITFDPEFADTVTENISFLPANGNWVIKDIQISVNSSYLCNLTEKITAKTIVQVLTKDGEVLAEAKKELEVLDYCQYWGNSFMPQYLAAFITPRHIALDPIITRASELLAQWTGNSSLSAYTCDVPNRPKMIVGALYEALAEQNITYCCPTMTLVNKGQKIRTCEELLSESRGKRGSCLDMAILMCSCLEAVGLHPLLVVQDEHAFAGCWLVDEMFADSVNDDPSVITKRMAAGINEVILVETTCANEGKKVPFDQAVIVANDSIVDVGKFSFVLDVARARLAGVHPLPQRIFNGNEYEVINPEPEEVRHDSPESVGETYIFRKEGNGFSRFDLWERRLLDLSTRNNLLNTRFTKNTLRIMVTSLDEMAQLLIRNRVIHVIGRPDEWGSVATGNDLRERISINDPIMDLLMKEMGKDTLRSYQDAKSLARSLTGLYRSARLSIEESGANTLFLALGFLKWYETGKAVPHFAPIVLYPIRLERKSANKGYNVVSRGEDPLLNETLFEFLKQNYNIEIPDVSAAAQNDKGIDVRYILAAVRKAVMEQDKWDVIEESIVSIFDFNRFVIWNDIRTNREQMSVHPLIDSLVSGRLKSEFTDEADGSAELQSGDIALPMSADSSQVEAICEAVAGNSFVLHGPPGTGKSQTITNIIANALFHGKRVLFVAEKMAALEVVQKRLASIGLAPFCLELHSNKTKKSLVMDQLRKTSEVVHQNGDNSFEKQAEYLDGLKRELNAHVDRLHKVHDSGLSVYDCFVRYSEIAVPHSVTVKLPKVYIGVLTAENLKEHIRIVGNYESVAGMVAEYNNDLREIGLLEYSPDIRDNIQTHIVGLLQRTGTLYKLKVELCKVLGLPEKEFSRDRYDAFGVVVNLLLANDIPNVFIANLNMDFIKVLGRYAELKGELEKCKSELFTNYDVHILDVNYSQLRRRWVEIESKWFIVKYFERKGIIAHISSYAKPGVRIDDNSVMDLFNRLEEVYSLQNEVEDLLDFIDKSYNAKYELNGADAQQLNSYYATLCTLLRVSVVLSDIWEHISKLLTKRIEFNDGALREYKEAYTVFSEEYSALEKEVEASSVSQTDEDWLDTLSAVLSRWNCNISKLRSKVGYNIVRKQVRDSGLDVIVDLFEGENGLHGDIVKIYLKSVYKHCANYYISNDKGLGFFQSILFEEKIVRFRKLCKEFENITRRELAVRLTEMLPALRKEAAQSSDVGFLQKCIRNGCRGISIRKLFDTIPDLISRMCPAMLMSPLSVSQYLGSNWPQFDMVIFDEASQMPTCEAVAAISRGKSTVIVGDEHQLPPTSFFMAENFSEQHSESEDLESILEDCLALSMPQKYLLWHYRSRHESLITFSNKHFYKNSLLTFPSNDDLAAKVSFEYVEGIYERGTGRNNKGEAKAVVEEIQKRLSDQQTSKQSIGVVTFNVNQQSLIEDMLNDMLHKNPHLEVVAAQMHESIFIKNLENVQGDERDVILFSVGYGRDKAGKVAMNFGPLNRDGGERRLNVAVSRARYEMKVFSSLRAEDIDLYRSNAKGVQYLKSFLEYAEKGRSALMHIQDRKDEKTKDAFIESVAGALQAKGYAVNTNIGSSEYRVDIGVIDSDNPNRYLLGLLCDGYNYLASRTAYDRDVTAPSVLTSLGWKTYHIWSVEWWDTPEFVLEGIVREIERIRCEGVDSSDSVEVVVEPESAVETVEENEIVEAKYGAKEYIAANLPIRSSESSLFSQGEYSAYVIADIRSILNVEAPISRQLLVRRLLGNYGINRTGTRINAYLTQIFKEMNLVTSGDGDNMFFWKDENQLCNYSSFREACEREALDIAPEEVVQAVLQVLKEQFAIDEEGLVSETSHLFGYANVRENVQASMKRGINHALEKGLITRDGLKYKLSPTLL